MAKLSLEKLQIMNLKADLIEAEDQIAEIFNRLEETYGGEVLMETRHVRAGNERRTFVELSMSVDSGRQAKASPVPATYRNPNPARAGSGEE